MSRLRAPLVTVALLAALALAGCGDDDGSGSAAELDTSGLQTVAPGQGTDCDYPSDGQGAAREVDPPPSEATLAGDVPVTLDTSIGDLALTLDADRAPCTVSSFVSLAQQGYFDDTPCHRLVTPDTGGLGVLQCGDPTGTGTGGPGYTIPDELDGSETYPPGTVAMAKLAAPDTGGSQFFLVYEDSPLPPDYTVFGTMDQAGIDAVTALAAKGVTDAGNGITAPAEKVEITGVEVG